jgi:hypothetical protein
MSLKPSSLRIPLAILITLFTLSLTAQIRISSPYSRFGIGDISDNNNAWSFSMGQVGLSFSSPYHVNYANPATYISFDSTSFVFEGGFNGDFVTLTSNYQTTSRNYASMGYMQFGIPVTKWWRSSIGLVPFSDVGYNVATIESYPTGTVVRTYAGSGGINRFYWGNAIKIIKNLSVGFNFSYLFGSMEREGSVFFPDSAYAMNFKVRNYTQVSDIYFNFGVLYKAKLRPGLMMNFAAVYAPYTSLSAKTSVIANTFLLGAGNIEYPKDTLGTAIGYTGNITIPTMAGGGISIEKPEKYIVGIDFRWQNWEKFTAFELSDSLVNSWQISAGGEIVPDANNYSSYLARVRYRIGFNYNKTYLHLRGRDLDEYSVSLGFGLPLRSVRTMLNIGAQVGVRGTIEQDLIRESYFKIVVGFSIYERWFVKRKYF